MKIKIISIVFSVLSVGFVSGGVISGTNVNTAIGDIVVVDQSGVLVSGGIAASGYFISGFDVSEAVANGDYEGLAANFVSMTSSIFGDTTAAFGTDIAGFYTNPLTNYGAPGALLGYQLYTFLGTEDTLAESVTSGAFGLIEYPLTINADAPAPDSNELNFFVGGSYTVLIGQTGGTAEVDLTAVGGAADTVNPTLALYSVIPEPSTALLGALGALGLLRRRR